MVKILVFSHLKRSLIECYAYREVLFNILSQHLKVKYKRTFLGYIWSLLNPILQLAVLTAVFSHVVRIQMPEYTLYLFSGFLPWTFFTNTLLTSSTALLESENFIKKIYLPKLIFPMSRMLLSGVDFMFSLCALSLIGIVMGFHFHVTALLLPLALLILTAFALGLSLVISVATVFFRDIQYLLGIALNLAYFLTPILYPPSTLPEKYRFFLQFNPMVVQINLFQKLIYFGEVPTSAEWAAAAGMSLLTFAAGLLVLTAFEEEIVYRM